VGSLSRGAYSWEQSGPSKRHRFWGSAISQNFRLSVLEAQQSAQTRDTISCPRRHGGLRQEIGGGNRNV
jgi:hypothetical protein